MNECNFILRKKTLLTLFFCVASFIGCSAIIKNKQTEDDSAYLLVANSDIYDTNAKMPSRLLVDLNTCGGTIEIKEPRSFGPSRTYRGEDTSRFIPPPFPRLIKITSKWSNGYIDTTELKVNMVSKKKYVLFAIELKQNQEPANFYIHSINLSKRIGYEVLYNFCDILSPTIAFFLLPVILPTILIKTLSDSTPPSTRPFENCCYLWIEDFSTGKVISGQKPI